MGIIDRIRRIAKANINSWLDGVEAPEAEVEAKIGELENAATEAKNALAAFAVSLKNLERELAGLERSRSELAAAAESALAAGDEKAARQALSEKIKADERTAEMTPALERSRATYAELKDNLGEIHDQLAQARVRLDDLRARRRAADAEKTVGRQLDTLRSPPDGVFNRLEDAVVEAESLAEIEREIRGEFQPGNPVRGRREAKVESELAALKGRLAADKQS